MFFQPLPIVVGISLILAVLGVIQIIRSKRKAMKIHWILRTVAILLILVAGLRPSFPSLAPAEVYNSRYDVYFVVDLTSSMVAEDWTSEGGTRLEGVREDINDLLDDYVGAKFSLITFNSTSTLRVPLTPDSTAVASAVNTMLPEVTMFSKGSSISEPVEMLNTVLTEDEENNERAKIVLYFGDGEQTASTEPESFATVADKVDQSKVYGYGTAEGGRMKTQTGYYIASNEEEYIKDSAGNDGVSIINEQNLQTIASELNGEYQHRTADTRIEPVQLTDDQKLELQETDGSSVNTTTEIYWVFLIPFALIMFIETGYLFRTATLLGVRRK